MLALDVNVVVTALRPDAERHQTMRSWLEDAVAAPEPVGISDVVLSGVARVLTHRRIFDPPSAIDDVLDELSRLRGADGVVTLVPGPRHWTIFERLCRQTMARGNLVPDAAHAAVAIEHGATMISDDGDFAQFPGLAWRRPLQR